MNQPFEQGFAKQPATNPYQSGSVESNMYEDGVRAGESYRNEKKNLSPNEAVKANTKTDVVVPEATTPSAPVAAPSNGNSKK